MNTQPDSGEFHTVVTEAPHAIERGLRYLLKVARRFPTHDRVDDAQEEALCGKHLLVQTIRLLVRLEGFGLPHQRLQDGLLCGINVCTVDVLLVAMDWLAVVEVETMRIADRSGATFWTDWSNTRACDKSPLFGTQRLPVLLLLKTARHNQLAAFILSYSDAGMLGAAGLAISRLATALEALESEYSTLRHLGFTQLCTELSEY